MVTFEGRASNSLAMASSRHSVALVLMCAAMPARSQISIIS